MGIRTFTFNGESSDTYGVMITQNESYNAPARAGEMVSIPGRNGAYWHDLGRFENIEVTYKCAIGEGTKADFVDAMSDIRSWLCSPVGYCRLEDDYNPNEYRLAVYKGGLETAEPFVTGAEFEITFDCKPQRFLKSGETAISVTSGNTITNPTLFEAKPLLEAVGYGNILLGTNEIISIFNAPIGRILISNGGEDIGYYSSVSPDYTYVNSGDTCSFDSITAKRKINPAANVALINQPTISSIDWYGVGVVGTVEFKKTSDTTQILTMQRGNSYIYGTASYPLRCEVVANYTGEAVGGTSLSAQYKFNSYVYVDSNGTIQMGSYTITKVSGDNILDATNYVSYGLSFGISQIFANSTKTNVLPVMIDLDTGEAYTNYNGANGTANNYVSLPAELPTLVSGANTITYDNTITSFKVVPRWWQV